MKIFTLFLLLFFSFVLFSQSKKEKIELLSQKIDSIYQVDSLKNVNISFLNNKVHELNEQNKILIQINENYKNELSNLEFRLYNDSILRNDLKLQSIYLENQLMLLNQ